MTILEQAKAMLGHRFAAHVTDDERVEIQAEQRYRTMAGLDEPLERRAELAKLHSSKVAPIYSKTW